MALLIEPHHYAWRPLIEAERRSQTGRTSIEAAEAAISRLWRFWLNRRRPDSHGGLVGLCAAGFHRLDGQAHVPREIDHLRDGLVEF